MKLEKDIAVFENVLNHDECQELIAHFNKLEQLNLSYTRIDLRDAPGHRKSDRATFPLEGRSLRFTPDMEFLNAFLGRFWMCYDRYIDHYSVLLDAPKQHIRSLKIQKTLPGQGYHVWHFESDGLERAGRVCAWGLYLNTVEHGGETEWLYQNIRIPATEGSLVIWPAGFPHTHRGNPPLSGEKFLVTGWVEF
jgi:hypothetical protein